MTVSEQLDLSILPEDARKELRDFYHFLVERYRVADSKDNEEHTSGFAKFLQEPFEVETLVTYSREALHER
ncbi:MAG: hypothetical protein ACLFU8_17390 [Anaerolineales bacterium]